MAANITLPSVVPLKATPKGLSIRHDGAVLVSIVKAEPYLLSVLD